MLFKKPTSEILEHCIYNGYQHTYTHHHSYPKHDALISTDSVDIPVVNSVFINKIDYDNSNEIEQKLIYIV